MFNKENTLDEINIDNIFNHSNSIKSDIIDSINSLFKGYEFTTELESKKNDLIKNIKHDLNFGNISYYLYQIDNIIKQSHSFQSRFNQEFIDNIVYYLSKIEYDFKRESATTIHSMNEEKTLHNKLTSQLNKLKDDVLNHKPGIDLQTLVLNQIQDVDSTLSHYKSLKNKQITRLEQELKEKVMSIQAMKKEYQDMKHNLNTKVDELYEQTMLDSLTNVYNRRGYEQIVQENMEMLKNDKIQSLYLILTDIDYFKEVNDKYGHDAGDAALKKITNILEKELRDNDYLCRIGGEEFAVIVRDCDHKTALAIAERLRKRVEKTRFKYRNEILNITTSLGLCPFRKDMNANSILIHADTALYSSKNNGRNKIYYYDHDKANITEYKAD
jgi:diguanylate cyclase (GGDEF)-like protein